MAPCILLVTRQCGRATRERERVRERERERERERGSEVVSINSKMTTDIEWLWEVVDLTCINFCGHSNYQIPDIK